MGKVIQFWSDPGAPQTDEEWEEHWAETEQLSMMRELEKWANNGQIFRVKEIHELTKTLLAKRGFWSDAKICAHCEEVFYAGGGRPAKHRHSKYCSPNCRLKAYRKRKKVKYENPNT